MVEALTITPRQQECIDSVVDAWKKGLPAIVSAPTGAGKTRIAIGAAYQWDADYMIVLGPKSSLIDWDKTLKLVYNPAHYLTATINGWAFCGTKNAPSLKQPYLYSVNRKGKGLNYYPSNIWKELVDNYKVIFVVDEMQMIKNPCMRTFAAAASSRYINLGDNNSRTIFLSYTPSDRLEMTSVHMYTMGMICSDAKNKNKAMVKYDRKARKWIATGLQDTLDYLELLGEETSEYQEKIDKLLSSSSSSIHREANLLAGNIFLDRIKKHIVFTCKPEFMEDKNLIPNYECLYCKVTDTTACAITKVLRKGKTFLGEPEKIEFKHVFKSEKANRAFGKLVKIHDSLEKIKCDIYVQLAIDFFEENPTGKVIIMVQYLANLDNIASVLEDLGFGVVKLEGKMSLKQRAASIEAFQKHDTEVQVLVGTIQTGGVSVSLHDTSENGEFPRQILIPPCPRVIDVVQASGRVFRNGVTSKPTISIIYTIGKDADIDNAVSLENDFYNKIWSKSKTIKRYHAEGQNDPLPCDYDIYLTEKVYDTFLDDEDYGEEEEEEEYTVVSDQEESDIEEESDTEED